MKSKKLLGITAILEIVIIGLVVWFDIFIPTLVIIPIMTVMIFIRREKFSKIGFCKAVGIKMVLQIFSLAALWTLVDIGVILPILNHLTGTVQNMGIYKELPGNPSLLLFLLAVSWTLAALGEELAYRGLIQNRVRGLFSNDCLGTIIAVLVSSFLFGIAHREQGIIGVVVTGFDALFFSFLRYKYRNMWASVLAHGFLNSIGIITFYFTGPIYGLW